MGLANKVALITGSSQGIGHGIAERFATEGADVVINYSGNAERAQEALRAVEATGHRGLVVQANVGKTDDIKKLFATALEHFGQLDILINNAGVETHAPFWDVTEDDFDKVLNINLKGTFFATQEFVKQLMSTNRRDKIVNISSVHEELPFPNFAAYCASKGGVKMLMRNLSVELGPLVSTSPISRLEQLKHLLIQSFSTIRKSSMRCGDRFH